jgi:hypothetical protein
MYISTVSPAVALKATVPIVRISLSIFAIKLFRALLLFPGAETGSGRLCE